MAPCGVVNVPARARDCVAATVKLKNLPVTSADYTPITDDIIPGSGADAICDDQPTCWGKKVRTSHRPAGTNRRDLNEGHGFARAKGEGDYRAR